MLEPIITGRGVEITTAIKQKINTLFEKHSNLLEDATKLEVILKLESGHKEKGKSFKLEITATMPKAIIRVEDLGKDFYSLLDILDPIFRRKLIRYRDSKNNFDKADFWKVRLPEEFDGDVYSDEKIEGGLTDYTPFIVKRKEYSDNTPISIGAAIEKMELIGHRSFLFRNIETDKYTMVYKRDDGNYGLVEPKYTE